MNACLQICEAYGANRYPFPEDPQRRREMNHEVNTRLQELHTTIEAGPQLLEQALTTHCAYAPSAQWHSWNGGTLGMYSGYTVETRSIPSHLFSVVCSRSAAS